MSAQAYSVTMLDNGGCCIDGNPAGPRLLTMKELEAVRVSLLNGTTEVAMSEPGDTFTDEDGCICTRDHWTGVYRSDLKVEAGFYKLIGPLSEEAR